MWGRGIWGSRLRGHVAALCVLAGVLGFGLITTGPAAAAGARCRSGYVALTFDDGPSVTQTPRLLRILTERHVPATFFMVGSRVADAPRLARRVANAGFDVGNHTWSHPMLTRRSDRSVRWQLNHTARELRLHHVVTTSLMRPPYGAIDDRVRRIVRDLGLVPVLWTVDSRDWAGGSARQIADRILAQLRPHARNVVLQHDGVDNSPASVDAVPFVVHAARQRGYCFTRLDRAGRMVTPATRRAQRRALAVPLGGPPPALPVVARVQRFGVLDPWFQFRGLAS